MSSVAPWPWVEPLWRSWSLLLNQANRDFIWPPLPTVPSMPSVYGVARLFNPDPAAYLPHRYPFLMLDRLLTLEAGVSASAERRVTTSAGGFPQVLLLEGLAQLAGIAAIREQGERGFLASIDHAEFSESAREGDSLLITARVVKSFGRLVLIAGEVACEGRVLLRAQMTLGVGVL